MKKNSIQRVALLLIFLSIYSDAHAADDAKGEPPPNKLTAAYYNFSSGKKGFDINLRHTFKTSTAWIGGYRESTGFDQARVGYEYDYHHEWLTVVPSGLAATRGFVGASLYAEMGKRWFGIGGMGVTNLRPYWNLGFEPNDYIQAGAGYRSRAGNAMLVYAIHDDKESHTMNDVLLLTPAARYRPTAPARRRLQRAR